MKTLYYNIIYKYKSIKTYISRVFRKENISIPFEMETVEDEPEYQEIRKIIDEYYNKDSYIPNFNPQSTALFMTLDPDNSKINYLNEIFYRRRIRNTCRILLQCGFDTFIVNSGTQYGMLAMEELLEIKKNGKEFMIYNGTIFLQNKSLLQNKLRIIVMIGLCDKSFEVYHPSKYIENVIRRVHVICIEEGAKFVNYRIISECKTYYNQFMNERSSKMDF